MNTKINVAAILKDASQGTKLYSPLCGDCWLIAADYRGDAFGKDFPIVVSRDKDTLERTLSFTAQGTLLEGVGECMLFPSKDMRDWDKFSWKRGDVLFDGDRIDAMFDGWAEDDYTRFNTSYSITNTAYHGFKYDEDRIFDTCDFRKLEDEDRDNFIKNIESEYGGKLNLETLEIEKPKPQFKDGDILHAEDCISGYIYICEGPGSEVNTAYCYKLTGGGYLHICDLDNFYDCTLPSSSIISDKTRYATEEEKQQLFDALAKEGKRWNAETKTLEDLPKKHEFKPFVGEIEQIVEMLNKVIERAKMI